MIENIPVEEQRELARLDGCTYVAVEVVLRYEGGKPAYYCPLSRWLSSDACKLTAAYERIAALEAQLAGQAPSAARTNGHQPPVACPICGREYRPGQSILVHLRKSHACNSLEEAHHIANESSERSDQATEEAEAEPEPEPE
jgi:hypothetical protein